MMLVLRTSFSLFSLSEQQKKDPVEQAEVFCTEFNVQSVRDCVITLSKEILAQRYDKESLPRWNTESKNNEAVEFDPQLSCMSSYFNPETQNSAWHLLGLVHHIVDPTDKDPALNRCTKFC